MKVGVITLSDKGYAKEREDISGQTIIEIIKNKNFEVVHYEVLPDEFTLIKEKLIYLCDNEMVDLILTTGGTGFSKRDITPEATSSIIERFAPGISEAMRFNSLQITKKAMLSRGVSGIRNNTLIINLPGSPKAVRENLEFIIDDLVHGLEILKGSAFECGKN